MREKTKRPEPSRPPWMVSHSVEASWRLYICIPAKSSRDKRDDSASEVPVPTTGKRRDGESGPVLPPGATGRFGKSRGSRARPLPSYPRSAATLPNSTLHNSPRRPPGISQPGTPGTLPSRANARPLGPRTRQLCGERTRKTGPCQLRPPLVRAGNPAGPVTHHVLPVGPICASSQERQEPNRAPLPVRTRQHPTRTCFPYVFLSRSRRLPVAPSSGVEEILRPKASLATAPVPGSYPHPEHLLPLLATALNSSSRWDHGP